MAVPPDRLDRLEDTEERLLSELRSARRDQRASAAPIAPPSPAQSRTWPRCCAERRAQTDEKFFASFFQK